MLYKEMDEIYMKFAWLVGHRVWLTLKQISKHGFLDFSLLTQSCQTVVSQTQM